MCFQRKKLLLLEFYSAALFLALCESAFQAYFTIENFVLFHRSAALRADDAGLERGHKSRHLVISAPHKGQRFLLYCNLL